MSAWRSAWLVAKWEFRRFVKWKQQLIGLIVTTVMMLAVFGVQETARGTRGDAPIVAVIGAEQHLPALGEGAPEAEPPVQFERHARASFDSLRAALVRRDIRGILVLRSPDEAELHVARDPVWRSGLDRLLAQARQQRRIVEAGLTTEEVAGIFAPVRVTVRHDEDAQRTRSTRAVGIFAVAFMLLALFTGAANAFVSITGEKQLRVTEQVVSAIPPQSWIDGKILGLTGAALIGAANTALVVLAFLFWRSYARGTGGLGVTIALPPATVIVFLVLVLLGSLFWLSLFGAVAATIDDPNSSMRSTLLFLPMFAAAPAAAAIPHPDSTFARIVGLVPITSPIGLPVRMLLGHPPWWEIVLSIALLAAATWWMRLAAGRIFRFGMLMYGKEASWSEMRRWAGRA